MKRFIKANIYDDFKNEYDKDKRDIGYIYDDAGVKEYLDDKVEITYFDDYYSPATLETPEESGIEIETDIKDNIKPEVVKIVFECLKENKTENTQEVYNTIEELKNKNNYYDDVSLNKIAEILVDNYDPIEWYYDEGYGDKWEENYINNYDPEGDRADYLYDSQF